MNFRKFAPILLLLIFTGFFAFAQRDSISLTTIVSKTDKLSTDYPFEKVYLHFDKPYYAVGDTIWFKAYLTVGPRHMPSGLSKIIYVDIISDRDSVVKSLKLPAINAVGFGDITLSKEIFRQGNYRVRAYTYWMRNFGTAFFFNKTISIGDATGDPLIAKISYTKTKKGNNQVVNARILYKDRDGNLSADKKVTWTVQNDDETVSKGRGVTNRDGFINISFRGNQLNLTNDATLVTNIELSGRKTINNTFPLKTALSSTDVQFFPEGGDLVAGVRSKVAFKAVGPDGLGVAVSGKIVDNTGAEVTEFTARHAGMGIFALLPEADKTYKASVTFSDGSKSDYDLPKVQRDGINLAINNSDPDNLTVKIATNAEFFNNYRNKGFYIIAQSGGIIYYTALAKLQSLVYTGQVAKSKFPTGVLQVTLFAANGEPLGERLVFIKHNDDLNISLNTDRQTYTTRQHVVMGITAKNNGLPVLGSFSVAVVDETKVPFDEDAETTILSSLLLTSDLKGYIEKPNYYFNHANDNTLADLDILMLTQGYRRFSYVDILNDKYPPVTFLPERGMEITGTLHSSTGVPVFKGNVNLRLPGRINSLNALTDANGQFRFTNLAIFDSSKIVLSARDNTGRNDVMITVDAPPYQRVGKSDDDPNEIPDIDSALSVYLQNSEQQNKNSHVLKEVVIRSTKTTAPVTHVTYNELTGLPASTDQTLDADRLKNCSFDLVSCLQSVVFGLWRVDDVFYIKRDYDAGNKNPIQFFVNGRAVDQNFLATLRTDEIALIEVYLSDGVSGINSRNDSNGIISITTKSESPMPKGTATDVESLLASGSTVTITPKGYYRARMFYVPKYDNQQSSAQRLTDLRTTVYWNPNVITDKNGKATVDFFNADGRGTYKVVIEGIDGNGNIGRSVLRYNVK